MSAPTLRERIAEVHTVHLDEVGWSCTQASEDELVYECSCGDQSAVLAFGFITDTEASEAAAWHAAHVADAVLAVVADWLTEDEQRQAVFFSGDGPYLPPTDEQRLAALADRVREGEA